MEDLFDVVVIGGGINGCGCAADAASRGLSVLLCEKDDLASKTSSSSSKLIHGGLRYLENFDISMVKRALDERQRLLTLAPHLVHPIPFVLPYQPNNRPVWLLRTGLFLYDHLSRKNQLPSSTWITRDHATHLLEPLQDPLQAGFMYYDCATDDARLTITNALQAKLLGATILTHTALVNAKAEDRLWHLELQQNQQQLSIKARSVINASGPWVENLNALFKVPSHYPVALVKGSHLLVNSCYEGDHGYVLQHSDKRIVFVVPYHGYTMIGTTDVAFEGDLNALTISDEESHYLLELVNTYFKKSLTQKDIVTSWSGVRTLLDNKAKSPKKLSRDYAYYFETTPAPLLTIYSGKLTTYRQLAKEAVDKLTPIFRNLKPSVTDKLPLPGGLSFNLYQPQAEKQYHWINPKTLDRLLHTYGTRTDLILNKCQSEKELGFAFGHGLFAAEVDYLVQEEWAKTADDILWRRTKLGLQFNASEVAALRDYIKSTRHLCA